MELNKEVLDAFSLKPKSTRKIKGLYIIETKTETYKIRTINIDENFILKSQLITNYLEKNNINTTDKYINSVHDNPFFTYRGETYVVSKYLPLKQNNFSEKQSVLNTSIFLSKFHNAVATTNIDIGTNKDILSTFNEDIKNIKNLKKRVIAQKNLKDFDLDFLKSSNMFLDKMIKCVSELNNTYFEERMLKINNNNSICHNNIKEENFEVFRDSIYVNNFMKISVNDQLLDLSSFIQRHLKVRENDEVAFFDIVNAYSKNLSLSDKDVSILKSYCQYPRRYVKTVLTFYSKNRSFAPTGLHSKLLEEINLNSKKENFYINI